jgi:dTMP kinase
MSKKRGVFIVFEGIDGSGKSTHIRLLFRDLQRRGFDVLGTAEPTRTGIGRFIRESIQDPSSQMAPEVEALLFAADRLNHVKRVIEPALAAGRVILSDRYVHSSLAYQGERGLDLEWIRLINRFAPRADLSIYLDIPPEIGVKRMQRRKKTVFETLSLQQRIRELYLRFVDEGDLLLIDGNRTVEEVQRDIRESVSNLLKEKELRPPN